jgi:hypothetical protein
MKNNNNMDFLRKTVLKFDGRFHIHRCKLLIYSPRERNLNAFRWRSPGDFGRVRAIWLNAFHSAYLRYLAMRTILGCRLHFLVSLEAGG